MADNTIRYNTSWYFTVFFVLYDGKNGSVIQAKNTGSLAMEKTLFAQIFAHSESSRTPFFAQTFAHSESSLSFFSFFPLC